ncbi:MAG: hypothetical protein ACRC5D_14920 [Aeromonas allosaccharophila]
MANSRWLLFVLSIALSASAQDLELGGLWTIEGYRSGVRPTSDMDLWIGYEQETQAGLIFADGQSAGLALPLYKQSFFAIGVGTMQVVERSRFSALWRLGWQLDDSHQLTLGQLYDVSGRYGQLWYMEHSLPLPAQLSLNAWLTRGNQAHMAAYDAQEGWREWGVTLERSWSWDKWTLNSELGARQWLTGEHEWQPVINMMLSYRITL